MAVVKKRIISKDINNEKVINTKTNEETTEEIIDILKKQNEEDQKIEQIYGGVCGLSFPDPDLLNYYKDRAKRKIFLYNEIDVETLSIAQDIIRWNNEDDINKISFNERVPIVIYFSSPGGRLDIALSIVDVINASNTPIIGINLGECNSAAALIYSACHNRFAMKNSSFMIHLGSGRTCGTYSEAVGQTYHWIKSVRAMVDQLKKIIILPDGYDFDKMIENDWYLYPFNAKDDTEDAVKTGLVDAILDYLI